MSWEAVPAATRSSFENFRRIHGARALFVSQELCRLSEAFDRAGLRYATFKGPTLAALLHGDVSRREYVDIDIIVPRQQIDDAERMLGEFGYRAADGPRAYRQAFLSRTCASMLSSILTAISRSISIGILPALTCRFL